MILAAHVIDLTDWYETNTKLRHQIKSYGYDEYRWGEDLVPFALHALTTPVELFTVSEHIEQILLMFANDNQLTYRDMSTQLKTATHQLFIEIKQLLKESITTYPTNIKQVFWYGALLVIVFYHDGDVS